MMYSKWLYDEIFFVAYHYHQPFNVIKMCMTPIERKFLIHMFVEQREKEFKELNKKTK